MPFLMTTSTDSVTTDESPPVTAPAMVGRCVNKVGTLCIMWTRVPLEERNGQGFGYVVQWKDAGDEEDQWNTVSTELCVYRSCIHIHSASVFRRSGLHKYPGADVWCVHAQENIEDPEADHFVQLVGEGNSYKEYDVSVRTRNRLGVGPLRTTPGGEPIRSAMGSKYHQRATTQIGYRRLAKIIIDVCSCELETCLYCNALRLC